jgi:isopentenyl diphosphate isomerase/L-lactate dehydrogenase-like FMN-dependent dehydrogenase
MTAAALRHVWSVGTIVRTETRAAMEQCGVRSVKELDPSFVRRAS